MSDERPSFLWEELGSIAPVILVAGAVLVVGGFFFRTAPRTTAPRNACINNLRQLDGAKEQWVLANQVKDTNRVVLSSDLIGPTSSHFLKRAPACPAGGTYTIGRVGEPPRCSNTNHSM
jgi:hypothetical protein